MRCTSLKAGRALTRNSASGWASRKEDLGLDLANIVYALDSTTIDLRPSLLPWAPFRSTTAAVKMHTLLELRGNIPSSIYISDGKLSDVNVLDLMVPERAAIYIMDCAYLDFERLFVTPAHFLSLAPTRIPICERPIRHRATGRKESSAMRRWPCRVSTVKRATLFIRATFASKIRRQGKRSFF